MNAKTKLILHPVRMRIVQTLTGDRKLTVQEMGQRLKDVPQASLYRHLNKLVEGEVIEAVEENQVRGTVEKVYALKKEDLTSTVEEFEKSSKEEQMGVFMQFVGGLIDQFGAYIDQPHIQLVKDGVSFRQVDLYLSDEEFTDFLKEIVPVYQKAMGYEPSSERKKRTVATIIIPEPKKGEKDNGQKK